MLRKDNPIGKCQLKFSNEENGSFEGYASVFNAIDQVKDTILPGAFDDAEGKTYPLFINHKHGEIPVGSIVVSQDDYGLFSKSSINLEHRDGPSAYSAAKRGDMTGLSIGFTMDKGDFEQKADGGRDIIKAQLKETSMVTFPCEPLATITSVKVDDLLDIDNERDLEKWIRDELMASNSVAKTLLSHARRILLREEAHEQEQIKRDQLKSLLATVQNLGK